VISQNRKEGAMGASAARNIGWVVVLLMASSSALAQTNAAKRPPQTPREFVQGFYNWYSPIALRDNPGPASDVALKEKRSVFSPELFRRLKEDSDAQAKCDEIVGIDLDPFLFSQDPDDHYEVGQIRQGNRTYKADVYGLRNGVRSDKPEVIAEFKFGTGHWFFVNFYSPDIGTDLLAILATPRPPCSEHSPSKSNH
jgi:hypothetical protein